MEYYRQNISHLPAEERDEYIRGTQSLRLTRVAGALAAPSLLKFWGDIGCPLTVGFGATELGGLGLGTTEDTNPKVKVSFFYRMENYIFLLLT